MVSYRSHIVRYGHRHKAVATKECTLSYRSDWTRDSHVTRAIRCIQTPCISRLEAEQSDNRYKNTNRHILLLQNRCAFFLFRTLKYLSSIKLSRPNIKIVRTKNTLWLRTGGHTRPSFSGRCLLSQSIFFIEPWVPGAISVEQHNNSITLVQVPLAV